MRIPFLLGHFEGPSVNANAQQLVNLYFEKDRTGGRDAHIGFPGLLYVDYVPGNVFGAIEEMSTNREIRGMLVSGGFLYVVCGNYVVRYNEAMEKSLVSTFVMQRDSGPVTMAAYKASGSEYIMITEGVDRTAYLYDAVRERWTKLTPDDHGFMGGLDCTYIDGFFVSAAVNSTFFYYNSSETFDPLVWELTDQIEVRAQSGNIKRIINMRRALWVFKEFSTEVYYNASDADMQFRKMPQGDLDAGCASTHSVVPLDNSVFWLTPERNIVRAAGYIPQIVSTPQVSHRLSEYARVDDALAFGYLDRGRGFYQITFPSANESWCYDLSTGIWSKRASYQDGYEYVSEDGRHRANAYAFFNHRHYIGDFSNGRLYLLDHDTYTDNLHRIRRVGVGVPLLNDARNYSIDSLEIEFESGTGLTALSQADPDAIAEWQQVLVEPYEFVLNGVLSPDGTADLGSARHVTLTSDDYEGDANFTIEGTDRYGEPLTEVIRGPSAETVEGVENFQTVTRVSSTMPSNGHMTVGTAPGWKPGEDPQAMLQWSKDGGHSWSYELWRTIGKIGEYGTRVRWNRLGVSSSRLFKLTITDPVKVVILGAYFEGKASNG